MIFDNVKNRLSYSEIHGLSEILNAFALILESDFPKEKLEIDGERIFINPVELMTKDEKNCVFESHRRYADVHCIISGEEKIIVEPTENLSEKEPYSEENDIGFYCGEGSAEIILKKGDFLLCFPDEAHKVAIARKNPDKVKKLVGKIKIAE